MKNKTPYHVAVLGGGPAGTAAAITLRTRFPTLGVTLIEASSYNRLRLDETLLPAARTLLNRMGVWSDFLDQSHIASEGVMSIWGSDEPTQLGCFVSRLGGGYHVDRERFDAWLAEETERYGVQYLRRTRMIGADRLGSGWRLNLLEHDDAPTVLDVDFAIDAGGRRAPLARKGGASRVAFDNLIGAFLFFDAKDSQEKDYHKWIEASPHGWWSGTRMMDGRIVIACMTDNDIARDLDLSEQEGWLQAFAHTGRLREWVGDAMPMGKPAMRPCQSGRLDRFSGEGWLAAGDAAASYDPLSGQGLVQALRSGVAAAYAAADILDEKEDAEFRYAHLLEEEIRGFLEARGQYYSLERRWPETPFWRRRLANPDLLPDAPLDLTPEAEAFLGDRDSDMLQESVEVAPGAERRGSRLHMLLSREHWRKLLGMCQRRRSAHVILRAMEEETALPEQHIALALQYLLEIGFARPGRWEAPATETNEAGVDLVAN
jgi:flavin-dependent dehydrogenase